MPQQAEDTWDPGVYLNPQGNAVPPPPKYTPPAPVATPAPPVSSSPYALVPPPPAPQPVSTSAMKDVIQQSILNDPNLKQQNEWLDAELKKNLDRAAIQSGWNQQEYDLAVKNASYIPNYGAGEASLAALDALAKKNAAHDYANQQEYVREALGSRGLASSGQNAVEQGELTWDYDRMLEEIDLRAQARAASYAAQAADAQQRNALQLQGLELSRQQQIQRDAWNIEDLKQGVVNQKGQLVLKTGEALMQAWWNGTEYVGPGGERWDAQGRPIGATAVPSMAGNSTLYAAPGSDPVLFAPAPGTSIPSVNDLFAMYGSK